MKMVIPFLLMPLRRLSRGVPAHFVFPKLTALEWDDCFPQTLSFDWCRVADAITAFLAQFPRRL